MGDQENGSCRIATIGYPTKGGYVRLENGMLAHRWAWEHEHGRIPEGLVIHHICENKWCVNVDHLQLMSSETHMRYHQRKRLSGNTQWVKFLVRGIDPRVLRLMRKDAYRRKRSVSDWMRTILCRHYSLDCPRSMASARKGTGATTFLLRLHPDLWQAVKDDAEESGRSMQVIVREILETPYAKKEKAA